MCGCAWGKSWKLQRRAANGGHVGATVEECIVGAAFPQCVGVQREGAGGFSAARPRGSRERNGRGMDRRCYTPTICGRAGGRNFKHQPCAPNGTT